MSPFDIMKFLKDYISKVLRNEFNELSKMPSLWTRSFFGSTTGNICSETIKRNMLRIRKRDVNR